VTDYRDFPAIRRIRTVCGLNPRHRIDGALLQLKEALGTLYLEKVRLLPEMAVGLGLSSGKVFIKVAFPGAEKYLSQLVEIGNLDV